MRIPCRKCLLSELDPDQTYRELRDYINSIDSCLKVSDATYACRLSQCRLCSNLSNGICILCGCFVEVRAMKKISDCPAEEKYWESE